MSRGAIPCFGAALPDAQLSLHCSLLLYMPRYTAQSVGNMSELDMA